ncbi:8-oxo-dGTP diphosphatase MutT [Gilvimarinus polysaccharolyticus]|uniref:8-oxo-dGTP diphosphatase MutT n=1 Tax=Gilvimarinus polysaccharolyticus TaxID=863921 RepID=UPI0006734E3B|nr:8-oxo-dGTP diphosphatase MutT [Gilvimarinus polysaccharolyticus]
MKQVHVAVGVLTDPSGKILIAKRPQATHQGGLWEFPGGKVEQGESVQQTLTRELYEELDVHCSEFLSVIQVSHDYGDKQVLLDVYRVVTFTGKPIGKEGQPLCWVTVDELDHYDFPAANYPIISALQRPIR